MEICKLRESCYIVKDNLTALFKRNMHKLTAGVILCDQTIETPANNHVNNYYDDETQPHL